MLKKLCSVPDKIYRYSVRESSAITGSRYEQDKLDKTNCKYASYAAKIASFMRSDSTLTEIKNEPISNVKLINGYLVKFDDDYTCHIDEDFIFDIAYNSLNQDGKLLGEYRFCNIGNDLKLLRVNSPLYNQVIASERRRNLPKIKKKAFQRGAIYSTPGGNKAIFLGKVDTYNYLGFTNDPSKTYSPACKNNLLFYDLFRYNKAEDFSLDKIEDSSYLSIKKTTSFTEQVGFVNVDSDLIVKIRKKLIKHLKNQIVEAYSSNKNSYYRSNNYIHYVMRKYGPFVNMVESGHQLEAPLDVNKYLIYA